VIRALSRRQWLQLSAATVGSLSLGGLLQAQAAAGESAIAAPPSGPRPIKACILIFYYGGPSHIDTYDMKPQADAGIRGEFRPISTSVPGLSICEHLPQMSKVMHHVALVRSMHHANRLHDAASIESLTGRPLAGGDRELFAPLPQFFPSYGGAVSYMLRERKLPVSFASLPYVFHNVVDTPCQGGGFLGSAHNPFLVSGDPEKGTYGTDALTLPESVDLARLSQRQSLVTALGGQASDPRFAGSGQLRRFYDRALELLSSQQVRDALDISREDARTRKRYGIYAYAPQGPTNGAEHGYARNLRGQNLLVARRLVEAGVPFVNVYDFKQQGQNWDSHAQNFQQHKEHLLPPADAALSALIEDLHARGLLESTLVVALGEFGRTPRINASAGRDHWPDCYTVLLAGGGVCGGSVYGASDKFGAYPARDPVTPADLAATIFWRFGISPATEIHDPSGRPYKLSEGTAIEKIFA
jgi:hypothetical protein